MAVGPQARDASRGVSHRPLGLGTGTVELTIKTIFSHITTREFDSPANSLRTPYVHVKPYKPPAR
eukprot:1393524-Pyramimonas_sp.AAC.1